MSKTTTAPPENSLNLNEVNNFQQLLIKNLSLDSGIVNNFKYRLQKHPLGDKVFYQLTHDIKIAEYYIEELACNSFLSEQQFVNVHNLANHLSKEKWKHLGEHGFFKKYIVHPQAVKNQIYMRDIFDLAGQYASWINFKNTIHAVLSDEVVLTKDTFTHIFFNTKNGKDKTFVIFKNNEITKYGNIKKMIETKYSHFL